MGGKESIRGFLIQTLIVILDSLDRKDNWDSLIIEPNIGNEKVDVLWKYNQLNKRKVKQIKSSQNQINIRHVKKWAEELKSGISADSYELILIGPCSQSVIELKNHKGVSIPLPKNLDIISLIEQSSHRLDKYLSESGFEKIPPLIRENLIHSLVSKFETYSTIGEDVSRTDFNKILLEWIFSIYPNSINSTLQMQCDIIFDNLTFIGLPNLPNYPVILIPMTITNQGSRTAIIEWIGIKLENENGEMLYGPYLLIDYPKLMQEKRTIHASNTLGPFNEFAIMKNNFKEMSIAFIQEQSNKKYPPKQWTPGNYHFKFFIKLRDNDIPLLKKEFSTSIPQKILDDCNNNITVSKKISKIEL